MRGWEGGGGVQLCVVVAAERNARDGSDSHGRGNHGNEAGGMGRAVALNIL